MTIETDGNLIQARKAWAKAMLEGDFASIISLYTDDVVIMPMDEPAVIGKQSVDDWYHNFHNKLTVNDWNIPAETVELKGDVALVRGNGTGEVSQDGMHIPMDFKFVEVWRRQADQSWKWSLAIWNSNVPTS